MVDRGGDTKREAKLRPWDSHFNFCRELWESLKGPSSVRTKGARKKTKGRDRAGDTEFSRKDQGEEEIGNRAPLGHVPRGVNFRGLLFHSESINRRLKQRKKRRRKNKKESAYLPGNAEDRG